jgi:hypothetical protein
MTGFFIFRKLAFEIQGFSERQNAMAGSIRVTGRLPQK